MPQRVVTLGVQNLYVLLEIITYESQPDKPVNRYKFYVHDLSSSSSDSAVVVEEEEWTTSETIAADILKWIEKGYCTMDITRKSTIDRSYRSSLVCLSNKPRVIHG